MTSEVSTALRRLVSDRTQTKCEYCQLHQDFSIYTHEIDHVIATKHNGKTVEHNLALACLPCNRYKGSDLTSFDPLTGQLTRLFNPRQQQWNEHFRCDNGPLVGLTAIGRTTVFLLQMNEPSRVLTRQMLMAAGIYP
jgi:HNH endonuclease